LDVGSKIPNREVVGRLETGVEEATHTVGAVVIEVTDGPQACAVKGSVVGKVSGDHKELVTGVPEDKAFLNDR